MIKKAPTYGNRQHYAPNGLEEDWTISAPPKHKIMGTMNLESTKNNALDYPGRQCDQFKPALYHLNNMVDLKEFNHGTGPPFMPISKSSTPLKTTPRYQNPPSSKSMAIISKKVYFCYNNPELKESKIERRFKNYGEVQSFYTV